MMGEFTDTELQAINSVARRHQSDIDLATVAQRVNAPQFSPYDIMQESVRDPSIYHDLTPEDWAAISVQMMRDVDDYSETETKENVAKTLLAEMQITQMAVQASMGLQLIKDVDEFWLTRPTVEAIFEFSETELQRATEYALAYEGSEYQDAIQQNKKSLLQTFKAWNPKDLSTENINRGLEMYEDCMKIFERTFPNLLAIKRVLEGQTPELEVVQGKSASSVRRELLDGAPESYSVYFDLPVKSFNSDLRNGIAHNDILTDPADSQVRIPTENTQYGYEEITEIVKKNFASSVFLTGTFLTLTKWRTARYSDDNPVDRPDWVFGERSVPEEGPSEWIEMSEAEAMDWVNEMTKKS